MSEVNELIKRKLAAYPTDVQELALLQSNCQNRVCRKHLLQSS